MSNIWQKIEEADMLLIGLGEEFDDHRSLKKLEGYLEEKDKLVSSSYAWLFPAYQQSCREKAESVVFECLSNLAKRLENKNYFVISTSMNDTIRKVAWREGRLVMPCGGSVMKQCTNGCPNVLEQLSEKDLQAMQDIFHMDLKQAVAKNEEEWISHDFSIGCCAECGSPLVLNNVYAEKYNENGYLADWQIYTKWLQGTVNRKLLILELGVGMQYPSVIRFPFEKVAFYNNKAEFYRVNENLYHLTEELKEKGTAISENAIDWLQSIW